MSAPRLAEPTIGIDRVRQSQTAILECLELLLEALERRQYSIAKAYALPALGAAQRLEEMCADAERAWERATEEVNRG